MTQTRERRGNEMTKTYVVITSNLRTIARDTFSEWKETFDMFRSEGIDIKVRPISDYDGPVVESDKLLYYHSNSAECPVSAPAWAR